MRRREGGKRCGRVRLAVITSANAEKLKELIDGKLEPETTVHTDGRRGYHYLDRSGYAHIRSVADEEPAHEVLPRVHRVFSLLKRGSWNPTRIGESKASESLPGGVHVSFQPQFCQKCHAWISTVDRERALGEVPSILAGRRTLC
jgi:hypothetical protein